MPDGPRSPALTVRRCGDRALLIDGLDRGVPARLRAALRADPLLGQVDVVVGAQTVLVCFAVAWPHASAVWARLDALADAPEPAPAATHTIDVVYDGADLEPLATALGTSAEALVAWHSRAAWRSEFTGFSPGFAYLSRPADQREIARRKSPRTRVPAGSVALAGVHSGIYPQESPGGWQLIGRTDAAVWDAQRAQPALIAPGDDVLFRPVRAFARAAAPPPPAAA
ncbi:MAG: carboxyltransferase domain-containing protein, partial [Microbacterium sp.]